MITIKAQVNLQTGLFSIAIPLLHIKIPQQRPRSIGRLHLPGGITVLRSLTFQSHHLFVDQLDQEGFPIAFSRRDTQQDIGFKEDFWLNQDLVRF